MILDTGIGATPTATGPNRWGENHDRTTVLVSDLNPGRFDCDTHPGESSGSDQVQKTVK